MQSHVSTVEIMIVWPIFKGNSMKWKNHYFDIGMLFIECIFIPFSMSLSENLHIWLTLTLSYWKCIIEWFYPNQYIKTWLLITVLIIIEITM